MLSLKRTILPFCIQVSGEREQDKPAFVPNLYSSIDGVVERLNDFFDRWPAGKTAYINSAIIFPSHLGRFARRTVGVMGNKRSLSVF